MRRETDYNNRKVVADALGAIVAGYKAKEGGWSEFLDRAPPILNVMMKASPDWNYDSAVAHWSNPRGTPVAFDEIMEALRTLDRQANGHRYRRVLHQRDRVRHRRPDGGSNTGSSIQ